MREGIACRNVCSVDQETRKEEICPADRPGRGINFLPVEIRGEGNSMLLGV
jgi:hypothetical protein